MYSQIVTLFFLLLCKDMPWNLLASISVRAKLSVSRWWFQIFFIFIRGGNDPNRRACFSDGWEKNRQLGMNLPAKYINSIFWWFYLDISICCVKKTCAVSVTLGSIHPSPECLYPKNVQLSKRQRSQQKSRFPCYICPLLKIITPLGLQQMVVSGGLQPEFEYCTCIYRMFGVKVDVNKTFIWDPARK